MILGSQDILSKCHSHPPPIQHCTCKLGQLCCRYQIHIGHVLECMQDHTWAHCKGVQYSLHCKSRSLELRPNCHHYGCPYSHLQLEHCIQPMAHTCHNYP